MNPFETEWWAKHGMWVFLAVVALLFIGFIALARGYEEEYKPVPSPTTRADLSEEDSCRYDVSGFIATANVSRVYPVGYRKLRDACYTKLARVSYEELRDACRVTRSGATYGELLEALQGEALQIAVDICN